MQPQTLDQRVERLERRVDAIEQLPATVAALESQIVNLGADMRAEFSATRQEMRAGDKETQHQMRMLHEDVINRFKILEEGRGGTRNDNGG